MGVPADQLAGTVEQWNEFCERGEDRAFYRPTDTLTPIVTAPFYAQLCNPALLNTDGGPVREGDGNAPGSTGSTPGSTGSTPGASSVISASAGEKNPSTGARL